MALLIDGFLLSEAKPVGSVTYDHCPWPAGRRLAQVLDSALELCELCFILAGIVAVLIEDIRQTVRVPIHVLEQGALSALPVGRDPWIRFGKITWHVVSDYVVTH